MRCDLELQAHVVELVVELGGGGGRHLARLVGLVHHLVVGLLERSNHARLDQRLREPLGLGLGRDGALLLLAGALLVALLHCRQPEQVGEEHLDLLPQARQLRLALLLALAPRG